MMDSKTRAKLRSYANTVEAILQVGKNGMGETLQKQVDDALTARELIKLTVLETAPETPKEMAATLAEATGAEVVQVVGRKVTLYRKNPEKTIIELRSRRRNRWRELAYTGARSIPFIWATWGCAARQSSSCIWINFM